MNKTNNYLFIYKQRFVTFILVIAYSFLHVKLTGTYEFTTPDILINFSSPLPFLQRILLPGIAYTLKFILPFTNAQIFFLLEVIFTFLLFCSLQYMLKHEFSEKEATLLSWLFLLLLPIITILNYRYTIEAPASFFYPYDTPALFFLSLSFGLILKKQWNLLFITLLLATLNRETSIIIVLLIPALYWQKKAKILKPFLFALTIYICIHYFILYLLANSPGSAFEWYVQKPGVKFIPEFTLTHFFNNIAWLSSQQNILLFIYCFAGAPLFWFCFYDYIPTQYKPLRYLALFIFLLLLIAGIIAEARIYSELVLILYLPICLSIKNWLIGITLPKSSTNNYILYYLNRYLIIACLIILLIATKPINHVLFLLSQNIYI